MSKGTAETGSLQQPDEQAAKLILALGRGRTGKSLLLRWSYETHQPGAKLRVVDADPNNVSLLHVIPEAPRPPSASEEYRQLWIEERINELAEAAGDPGRRFSMLLDLGWGDVLLKRLDAECDPANYSRTPASTSSRCTCSAQIRTMRPSWRISRSASCSVRSA